MKRLDPSERTVVERLQKCCEGRYLRYSGNVLNDAFHILLHRIEHIHALLPQGSLRSNLCLTRNCSLMRQPRKCFERRLPWRARET